MRPQNPSHAVRKNNGPILHKNACIVGLFTSAASLPRCRQGWENKAPALSLPLAAEHPALLLHRLLTHSGGNQHRCGAALHPPVSSAGDGAGR